MKKRLVVAFLLLLGLAAVGAIVHNGNRATAANVVTPGAPQSVQEAMSAQINGLYGGAPTVVQSDTTTQAAWAQLEPNPTSGLSTSPTAASQPVYGFVITGNFTVHGPVGADPGNPVVLHQGRVVVDANGDPLSIWLWPDGKLDAPTLSSAFGAEFNVS